MASGRTAISSARPKLVSVRPQASAGATAATWRAAAEARTRFAGLAGNVDVHAEAVAQPARLQHGAKPPELDRLEARAARGVSRMMALDVVGRVNALVRAHRDLRRRGDARHTVEIVRLDRLLEKIEAAIANRAHVIERFGGRKTLIGVGRDQAVAVVLKRRTDGAGALAIGPRRSKAHFDLEGAIAQGPARFGVAQIGGGVLRSDHGQERHPAALLRAEEGMYRPPGGVQLMAQVAADRVVDTGAPFTLNPMNARERRIIHLALRDRPQVQTQSDGMGQERKVVIFPTK